MKSRLQSSMSGGLSRALRIAQLGAVRVTASATNSLQRKARHLEAKLDGLDKGLAVRPISDIAWPSLRSGENERSGQRNLGLPRIRNGNAIFQRQPRRRSVHLSPGKRRPCCTPLFATCVPTMSLKSEAIKPEQQKRFAARSMQMVTAFCIPSILFGAITLRRRLLTGRPNCSGMSAYIP